MSIFQSITPGLAFAFRSVSETAVGYPCSMNTFIVGITYRQKENEIEMLLKKTLSGLHNSVDGE